MNTIAFTIPRDLDFDVACLGDEALDEKARVAKCGGGLVRC